MAASPETQRIVRQSLALIVQSEKVLAQLEDHLSLLRTIVDKDDDDDRHEGVPTDDG